MKDIVQSSLASSSSSSDSSSISSSTSSSSSSSSSSFWDGAVDLGNGWKWLSWFGYFSTIQDPWIFHLQHGWMYSIGTKPSSVWLWTSDMGWLWTSDITYPYLYRNKDSAWLYYVKDSMSPRWFYNFKTSSWESDTAVSWDHLIGMGNFVGLEPWFSPPNGISNDAPKDIPTLIKQFAQAGGNLIQLQLLYIEGAVFSTGHGLQLDNNKVNYCINYRNICKNNGVCVTFVLFDYCTLKKSSKWAKSPLNIINGGPFTNALDIYSHFELVSQYVTDIVNKLDGDNVAWEICNEGSYDEFKPFAAQVRDLLHTLGVTRVTTSGANPGGLWRFSPHGCVDASDVKANQLPNSDGETWSTANVAPVCSAIRSIEGSGLVFDGVTDDGHNWADFLANIKV